MPQVGVVNHEIELEVGLREKPDLFAHTESRHGHEES